MMILKYIIISYANIYLKEGILFYTVLKINIYLTFSFLNSEIDIMKTL